MKYGVKKIIFLDWNIFNGKRLSNGCGKIDSPIQSKKHITKPFETNMKNVNIHMIKIIVLNNFYNVKSY